MAGIKAKGWVKEATVLPYLTVYTILLSLLYICWFQELFIIWYGANEFNLYSKSLYFQEFLFSLIPLAGWFQRIRDSHTVYFLLLLFREFAIVLTMILFA